MKWLTSLLLVVSGMVALFVSGTFAASSKGVAIESIAHKVTSETEEQLTFKLTGQAEAKIFTIKGDNPRLVLDFPNTAYTGKGFISVAEGKLATIIRSGHHETPERKTRIVVDLAKQIPVRYTSSYSETDNILTVNLLSDAQKQPQVEAPPVTESKQEVAAPQASPEEVVIAKPLEKKVEPAPGKQEVASPQVPSDAVVIGKPMEKKLESIPVPPQEPKKKAPGTPVTQTTAPAKTDSPQLLGISFDDFSDKGEMVLFHLSAFQPPAVSAVEKGNPKVFCDFVGMELSKGVEENIVSKGKYVERITTTRLDKPDKIRVVLNLMPSRDYDLQQVFFKKDNLFVLIVNELPPEKSAK